MLYWIRTFDLGPSKNLAKFSKILANILQKFGQNFMDALIENSYPLESAELS